MISKSKADSYENRFMKSKLFKKFKLMKILLFGLLMVIQICNASEEKPDQYQLKDTDVNDKDPNTDSDTESINIKRKADVEFEQIFTVTNKKTKLDENHEILITDVKLNQQDDVNLNTEELKNDLNNVDHEISSFSNIPTSISNTRDYIVNVLTDFNSLRSVKNNLMYLPNYLNNSYEDCNPSFRNQLQPIYNPSGYPSYLPYYPHQQNHYNPNYPAPDQIPVLPDVHTIFFNNPHNNYNTQEKIVEKISPDIVKMGDLVVESNDKEKVFKRMDGTAQITESELDKNFRQHINNIDRYGKYNHQFIGSLQYLVLERDALILEEYYKVYYGYAIKYLCQHKDVSQNVVKIIVDYLTAQSTLIVHPDARKTEWYQLDDLVQLSFKYRNLLLTKTSDPPPLDRVLFYPVPRSLPPPVNQNTLSMLPYYFTVDHYCLDLYHTYISNLHVSNEIRQKVKIILPSSTLFMWVQYPELAKCIFPDKHSNYNESYINITSSFINSRDNALFIFADQLKKIEISQVNLGGLYFPRDTQVDSRCIQIYNCSYVNWTRINLPTNVIELDIHCSNTEVVSTIDTMTQENKNQVEYLKLFNVIIDRLDLTSFQNLKKLLIKDITSHINETNWNLIKLPANNTFVEFELYEYVELGKKFINSSFFKSLTHLCLRGNVCLEPIVYPPQLQYLLLDLSGSHTANWATNLPKKIECIEIHLKKYDLKTFQTLLTCDLTALLNLKQLSVKLFTLLPDEEKAQIKKNLFQQDNLKVNNVVRKEFHLIHEHPGGFFNFQNVLDI